jgi:hypothetical protein
MKEKILKCLVAFCLIFCAYRIALFVNSRIPPYKVGECYVIDFGNVQIPKELGYLKIQQNRIIDGVSVIEIHMLTGKEAVVASFDELRGYLRDRIDCP